jgi:hypothetical protein
MIISKISSRVDKFIVLTALTSFSICIILSIVRITTGNYLTVDSLDYYNLTGYWRSIILGEDVSEVNFIPGFDPGESRISIVRLFRPVVPILALPLSFITSVETSFFITNTLLIIVSSLIVFVSAERIGRSRLECYSTAVLFTSSYFVLSWGISILVEAGSWFFTALSIFIGIRIWINHIEMTLPKSVVYGFVLGFGVLTKEFNIAGILFVVIVLVMIQRRERTKSFISTIAFFLASLVPPLMVQLGTWLSFGYTYYDYFLVQIVYQSDVSLGGIESITNYVWSYYLAFGLMIPFSIIGYTIQKESEKMLYLLMLVCFSLPNIMIISSIFYARFAAHSFPFFLFVVPPAISHIVKSDSWHQVKAMVLLSIIVANTLLLKYFLGEQIILTIEILIFASTLILSLGYAVRIRNSKRISEGLVEVFA